MDIAEELNDVVGRLKALEEKVCELEGIIKQKASPSTKPSNTIDANSQEPDATAKDFEVLGIASRITKSSGEYSYFAWKLDLRSVSQGQLDLYATIQFLDADGFEVEKDVKEICLMGGGEGTFRGSVMVHESVVESIASVAADIEVTG